MFKTMLEMMEAQASSSLAEKKDAGAMWFLEWARLFRRAFEPSRKVVYTSLYAFPMELVAAFDAVPFDCEIAGSMIATTDLGVPVMIEAEERGHTLDMCPLHRTALGADHRGLFPEPAIVLTTSFYCDGKAKMSEIIAASRESPFRLLYVPAEISRGSVEYVKGQLRGIARDLEEALGQRFDIDRLRQAVRSSNRARRSQLDLLDLLANRPAPWNPRQMIPYSVNSQLFNGTEVKERLDAAFLDELRGRIQSPGPNRERHRLYWFAWLPTYRSVLFQVLKERGVGVPVCETLRVHWDEVDEADPFEGLALKCMRNPFVGPVGRRLEGLADLVDRYGIDGAIVFATPACRHSNNAFLPIRDSLAALRIPVLTLDMDIADPRGYSPEAVRTRLEGFAELLDGRRAAN